MTVVVQSVEEGDSITFNPLYQKVVSEYYK